MFNQSHLTLNKEVKVKSAQNKQIEDHYFMVVYTSCTAKTNYKSDTDTFYIFLTLVCWNILELSR